MDLPVSEHDMHKAFDFIDVDGSGTITREEFQASINLTKYQANMKKAKYLVSKV